MLHRADGLLRNRAEILAVSENVKHVHVCIRPQELITMSGMTSGMTPSPPEVMLSPNLETVEPPRGRVLTGPP